MKRKTTRNSHVKKTSYKLNQLSISTLLIGISILLLFLFAVTTYKSSAERKVLGITTGPILLARGGDDDGSSDDSNEHSGSDSSSGSNSSGSNSGSSNSGDSGSSNTSSGSSNSSSSSNDSNNSSSAGSSTAAVSKNTTVLCTGPDNKQFQTDYEHCSELNSEWNHPVVFTVLSKPKKKADEVKMEEPVHVEQENEVKKETIEKPETESNGLEVKSEDNKTRIDIKKAGTKVRIKIEDGKTAIRVKHEDENEVALEEQDALEKVNEALKDSDVEIRKTNKNTIAIRNGEVEAETHTPLSVDPLTHELTIETAAGTKKVTILPEQAINAIVSKKLLTNIESEALINSQNETEQVQKVELTELNGEAIFKVKGVLNKKLLGIFEIALPKTVLSSAETGEIRNIDESIMSKILEILSF